MGIYSVLFVDRTIFENNNPIKGFYLFADNENDARQLITSQLMNTTDEVLLSDKYEMIIKKEKN